MNTPNQYSDEHINAYIDGELDNEECSRLLFDEQQDAVLAKRISDARILKEKVHLAYSDLYQPGKKQTPRRSVFINRQRSLVASILVLLFASAITLPVYLSDNDNVVAARQLIKNTVAISPEQLDSYIGENRKVVINLSQYHPETFDDTIEHIEMLLKQHENENKFNIEIVAHRQGLRALDTRTSKHAGRISALVEHYKSLDVVACAKSMADLADADNPIRLMSDILITPSAAEQVAKRLGDGWMYLKL